MEVKTLVKTIKALDTNEAIDFMKDYIKNEIEPKKKCCRPEEYPKFSQIPENIDILLDDLEQTIKPGEVYEKDGLKWVQHGDNLRNGFLICSTCGSKDDVYGASEKTTADGVKQKR